MNNWQTSKLTAVEIAATMASQTINNQQDLRAQEVLARINVFLTIPPYKPFSADIIQ